MLLENHIFLQSLTKFLRKLIGILIVHKEIIMKLVLESPFK